MTLRRQFSLMASALIFLLLSGNLVVTVKSASDYFQQQLNARAYDAATSLALSMSNAAMDGDSVKLERMIDVLFDRGFFSEIKLELISGGDLYRRATQATVEQPAPQWFINLVNLEVVEAQTDVTSGWSRLGSLSVRSHTDFAYRDLWSIVSAEIIWFMWMALISLVALQLVLRWLFKPLVLVEQQALDISERNLYEQTSIPRSRELRRVVLAMNKMVKRLKILFDEQAAISEQLRTESFIDENTGLLNRRGFDDRLQHEIDHSEGRSGILILMQLKDFAGFNQHQGREAGDALLSQLGSAIQQWHHQHTDALVSRRSGSDFAVFVPATDRQHGEELTSQFFGYLSSTALSKQAALKFHMGAVMLQSDHLSAAENKLSLAQAFSCADVALRQAQLQQQNHFVIYDEEPEQAEWSAGQWKDHLQQVLEKRSIKLHFLPVIDAVRNEVLHYEVLSRIQDEKNLINAARFWPMVERHQLAPAFDLMVIESLLVQLKEQPVEQRFCINLSAASVLDQDFQQKLEQLFIEYPEQSALLNLEVAEFAIANIESSLARLAHVLKRHQVGLGVDQVGTGSIAFAYLQRLPLDYLRIAGSFNRGLHQAMDHRFFVQSMVQIAHNLDLRLLGDGVESKEDVQALKNAGVDGVAGYFFSAPIDNLQDALTWQPES